ncbi:MAG: fibronectin type III domain-containing protein [Thermoplasmatota archaeon]
MNILGGGIPIGVIRRSFIVVVILLLSFQAVTVLQDRASTNAVSDERSIPSSPEDEGGFIGGGFFTENLGQWSDEVRFSAMTGFGTAIFKERSVLFRLEHEQTAMSVAFKGSEGAVPVGILDMGFPTNFFLGNESDKWVTGARSYERIVYEGVWTGIDVEYYFSGPNLKYDIVVHPGGDPEEIEIKVSGQEEFKVGRKELSMALPGGSTMFDGELKAMSDLRADIPVKFARTGIDTYGFDVEKVLDETLVIDPLIYSTVIADGGYPLDFTKDDRNCTYFFTLMYGLDPLITPGVFNTTYWRGDYYLLKMNSSGTGVVFATVIGGYTADLPVAVKVDSNYDIYLGGRSCSPDFPTTPGVIQETHKSVDDFTITKLNSTGDKLIYSTFIGGSSGDLLGDIGVFNGCVYVAGYADSKDIPSKMGPIGGVHGILYFSVINQNATAFLDSMIWDGYYTEYATCLEIDTNGEVVIGGFTSSSDFPATMHSYQNFPTGVTARGFVLRYNPFGLRTIFSSIVGGCSVYDLKIDANSDIYYSGVVRWDPHNSKPVFELTEGTFGEDFFGYNDIFVAKLDGNGTGLHWSTVVGGSQNETNPRMDLDENGNTYIIGKTQSRDHPTTSTCYDPNLNGEDDVIFFKLSPNGSTLLYSSYLGTNGTEESVGIILESMNNITLLGITSTDQFPITEGAFTLGNSSDGGLFISTFTISTVPGRTLNLSAVEGDGNISLSWEPPIDEGNRPITNYQVYRGPDPFNLTRYVMVGPEREFIDIGVDFGVEYHYGVSAVNDVGEGALSNIAWNISSTLPDPPSKLKAEVNIGYILLTFEPPLFTGGVAITGYSLYRNGERIAALGPGDLSYLDSSIGLGSDYTYDLTTWNRNGESIRSKGVSVRSKNTPSPPMNLTVRPLRDRIVIRWEEPKDFGGLDINRYVLFKGTSEDDLEPVRSLDPETIYLEDTFVVKGEEYFYSVSAYNDIGGSEMSSIVSTVPMSLPSKPYDLRALPGIGYINLSWSAPLDNGGDDELYYRLYHGTSDLEPRLLVVLHGNTTRYQHTGLEAGVKHQYFVTVCNLIGESDGTDVVYASSISLPMPPSDIRLEPGPGSIKISWGKPSSPGAEPAREYLITRRSGSLEPSLIATIESGTRSFLDELVVRKTLYFYSIQTVTETGTSDRSREFSERPLTYPDPPVNLRVEVTGNGLAVSWEPPDYDGGLGITWYSVFRKDPAGLNVLIKNVDGNKSSIIDNSVDPGFYYSYTVKAHNLAGPSEPSQAAGNIFPGPPMSPKLVLVEFVGGNVMVSWVPNATDQGENTDSYNIYRTTPGEQVKRIAIVEGDLLIFLDGGIENGVSYEYYITAENEAGESSGSNRVKVLVEWDEAKDKEEKSGPDVLTISMAALLVLLTLVIIFMATAGKKEPDVDETYDWEEE